jgi:hypothetical protein
MRGNLSRAQFIGMIAKKGLLLCVNERLNALSSQNISVWSVDFYNKKLSTRLFVSFQHRVTHSTYGT